VQQALILGTGGHSRVILSILATEYSDHFVSIVELGAPRPHERIMGKPVDVRLTDLHHFRDRDDIDVFLAIGDQNLRKTWWEKIKSFGLRMPNLISPHAYVDETAVLGESNIVCARAFVGPEAKVGSNNLINTAAILEHEVRIGDHCSVAPSALILGRCRVGNSCFVGANATLVDGISVASRTIIGAGAVVIKTVEREGGTYIGVPAKNKEG
jgi:UDP-N-acetylbacillosamine N-acetyltransferase